MLHIFPPVRKQEFRGLWVEKEEGGDYIGLFFSSLVLMRFTVSILKVSRIGFYGSILKVSRIGFNVSILEGKEDRIQWEYTAEGNEDSFQCKYTEGNEDRILWEYSEGKKYRIQYEYTEGTK